MHCRSFPPVLCLLLCLLPAGKTLAAKIVFGGVTTNAVVPSGYGSNLSTPSAAVVEEGGWTPHVALTWSGAEGTRWDFYNDAEWPGVAQTDGSGDGSLPREWRIAFTAETGFGVKVSRFVIDDYANYAAGHTVTWELRQDSAEGAVLFSGNLTVPANANVPVVTGMEAVQAGTVVLVIRQTAGAGDDLAIDDLQFEEAAVTTVTWNEPDAILTGTPLSDGQLNASANVAGTFTYNPPAGTVLAPGPHVLEVDFETAAPPFQTIVKTVDLLVKTTAEPLITHTTPLQLSAGKPMTAATLALEADVQGSFATTPVLGTVFSAPGPQNVTVVFTPASATFNTVTLPLTVEIVPEGTLWNFSNTENRYAAAYGPSTLMPFDPGALNWASTKISFGTAQSFGIPVPPGGDREVLRFQGLGARESLALAVNEMPNGYYESDGWVSNYTIIMDLFVPETAASRLPLWNTNVNNANASEGELTNANPPRLSMAGQVYETVPPGAWHRLAIVVRSAVAEGQAHLYLDGRFIGAFGSNDSVVSVAYALEDVFHVLADSNAGGTGYLASLRFVPRVLDYPEVTALGQMTSAGADKAGAAPPPFPYAPRRRPFIIGHRGDSAFAPEDTLPAVVRAFEKGADACEVDIRLTGDSVAVLMHDGNIDRTTDGSGGASGFTLAQLQQFDAGSWFGPAFDGTKPPSLAEVLAAAKGRGVIYLDIKIGGMLPAIRKAVEDTGFDPGDLFWWTYGESTLTIPQIKAVYPHAKILWEDNTARNNWGSWSAQQKQTWIQQIKTKGIWGFDYGSNFATISPAFIADLHDAGFFVSVYSLLSPESIDRATETAGVDGFETDIPGVAAEMFPALSLSLAAVPLGSQTVRLRWTDATVPVTVRYDVYRRTTGTGAFNWTLLATLNNPVLTEYADRTAAASTKYEYLVVRHNGTRPVATTNGLFATTPAAGTEFEASYDEWAGDDPALADLSGDGDGDGLTNFVEFAFATSPGEANAPSGFLFDANGHPVLRRRHGGGLTWGLQSSQDMQNWTPLVAGTDYTETVTPDSYDEETVVFTPSAPADKGRLYYRVQVQSP